MVKRITRLGILGILALCSCSQEFYPFDPDAKPIPIVFGLIDTHDSIHTIRLTKTFTGSEDAFELARDTANLLYDSVRMIIECLDDNLKVVDSLTFHKTYFTPPSSGIFNSGKSWFYVSTNKFPAEDSFVRYRIKAWLYDTDEVISSKNVYDYENRDRTKIDFPSKKSKYLSVYNESVTIVEYSSYERMGVKIRFNYSEVSHDNKTVNTVEDFWVNTTGIFYLTPAKLFLFIKNAIPDNPDVDYRLFNSLDILTYSADGRLLYYNKLFNADKSFFSYLSFFETPYPNIINGYGLFYRYSKDSVTGLKFDQKTMDSLVSGEYTKGLKFVGFQ